MTTPAQIREDFRQFRTENKDDHAAILDQLRTMNGTQKEHSVAIATLATTQATVCKRLDKGDEERGKLFSLWRALDKHKARQAGYIAGVMLVVSVILQFVVLPLFKHVMSGG